MRMRRIGTERGAACVPAEMMQLVANVWHFGASDDLRVGFRFWIEIEHAQRVMLPGARVRIERDDVAKFLARRLHRHPRRGVKSLIRFPQSHEFAPPSAIISDRIKPSSHKQGVTRNGSHVSCRLM